MTIDAQDFSMHSGDSKVLEFTVLDDKGDPFDLTGASIRWYCSRGTAARFSPEPDIQKHSGPGGGIEVLDLLGGEFRIRLVPADTASLVGTFYHECQVVDTFGNIATVATGALTIRRQLITATT